MSIGLSLVYVIVIVKVTHDSTPLLRILALRIFPTTCYKGLVGLPICLLCFIFLSYFSSFSLFLFWFLPFHFISASFSLAFPSIPYQTSCHPIHIAVLLYICLVILSFYFLQYSFPLSIWFLCCIVLQILLPGLLHFLDFLLVPRYLLLPYIPSTILSICSFP